MTLRIGDYALRCALKPRSEDECWRPPLRNALTGEAEDARNPQLVKLAVETVVAV